MFQLETHHPAITFSSLCSLFFPTIYKTQLDTRGPAEFSGKPQKVLQEIERMTILNRSRQGRLRKHVGKQKGRLQHFITVDINKGGFICESKKNSGSIFNSGREGGQGSGFISRRSQILPRLFHKSSSFHLSLRCLCLKQSQHSLCLRFIYIKVRGHRLIRKLSSCSTTKR